MKTKFTILDNVLSHKKKKKLKDYYETEVWF